MMFDVKNYTKKEGSFRFSKEVKALANECLSKDIILEFWKNFSCGLSSLTVEKTDELIFCVGKAEKISAGENEYAVSVEPSGLCIASNSKKGLLHGFMTLIEMIRATDTEDGEDCLEIACCYIEDTPEVANRMVHYCVFPETELWEIERFVRFCGALKYTHIVIEFWGMLKYDCLKELSWDNAYEKEQIRPIISMARDLGLELIPMFNQWGHATAGRVMHGKHVVLDQNPSLASYFSDDGWCWNIRKPKVRALLRKIREELIELFGEGEYFHIGCDEAYDLALREEESQRAICEFINATAKELKELGRRTLVWGDMFLYRYPHYNEQNRYACNAPTPECEKNMLALLDKDVIIADWQYDSKVAPVETSKVFTDAGFDCVICPWDRGMPQLNSCITTAKEQKLLGVMHTTWHTLSSGTPYTAIAAVRLWGEEGMRPVPKYKTETATLLRRVYPVCGKYERAGWASRQIGVIT